MAVAHLLLGLAHPDGTGIRTGGTTHESKPLLRMGFTRISASGNCQPGRPGAQFAHLLAALHIALLVVQPTARTLHSTVQRSRIVALPSSHPEATAALGTAFAPLAPRTPSSVHGLRLGHWTRWQVAAVHLRLLRSHAGATAVRRTGIPAGASPDLHGYAAGLRAGRPRRPLRPSAMLGAVRHLGAVINIVYKLSVLNSLNYNNNN